MAVQPDSTTLRSSDDPAEGHAEPALSIAVLHSPDSTRAVLALTPDEALTIGRGATRGLLLQDPRMSRAHLRIVWDPLSFAYRYADLESANGTFVNGKRIDSGFLCEQDVVRIGDSLLLCSARDDDSVNDLAVRAAPSNLPVLILGETGAGKERLAQTIHDASGREGRFVPVNVAALPRELAAAELFGHTRGAFSGANLARTGLFRSAERGTLFLDEIGDLSRDIQPALLRALQDRMVRPVGADSEEPVDVRIVAATNIDLEAAARRGDFREDLLARIAHIVLHVPPLRKRRGEILELVRTFAPHLELTPDAAESLLLWDWPRNIRELLALVQSLVVLHPDRTTVLPSHLPENVAGARGRCTDRGAKAGPSASSRRRSELVQALQRNGGNVAAVARELGKPRSHVYRWLHHLGIKHDHFRKS